MKPWYLLNATVNDSIFQNPDNMGFYLIKAFSLSKLIEQFQGLTISKNLVSASQDAVLMWASNGKKMVTWHARKCSCLFVCKMCLLLQQCLQWSKEKALVWSDSLYLVVKKQSRN